MAATFSRRSVLESEAARLRCADCRELHLVAVTAEAAPVIVAVLDKS
jgi:hypothetical protein